MKLKKKIKAQSNKDIINFFKPSKFKTSYNKNQRKSMEVNSIITNEHFKKGSIKKNKNTSDKIIYEDDKESESKIYKKKSIAFMLP